MAGESLIIVRDQKSKCADFTMFAVIAEHGCKKNQSGHASAIQCPYHAWTYGLDGRLIGAPHMDEVPGFDKADYSLHAVNLALWEGFIFVNLARQSPATPLENGSRRCSENFRIGICRSCARPNGSSTTCAPIGN